MIFFFVLMNINDTVKARQVVLASCHFSIVDGNGLAPLGCVSQPRKALFMTCPRLNACFVIMQYNNNAYSIETILPWQVGRISFLMENCQTFATVIK